MSKSYWKTLALTHESAMICYQRKGIDFVNYLRERRTGGSLKAFHRKRHLAIAALKARP